MIRPCPHCKKGQMYLNDDIRDEPHWKCLLCGRTPDAPVLASLVIEPRTGGQGRGPEWSAADDAQLIALFAANRSVTEIAATLGRSYTAIVKRGTALRKRGKMGRIRNTRYSAEDDALVLAMKAAGEAAPAIAARLGRTVASVRDRWHILQRRVKRGAA